MATSSHWVLSQVCFLVNKISCVDVTRLWLHSWILVAVPPVVEHVSGNTAEFQMRSLLPGTTYSVGVYGVKGAQKSASAVTEFTTGGCARWSSRHAWHSNAQPTAAFKPDSASAGVDPPRDLTATNVQIESATLTWKPPQAAITGYMLSFSSADAVIRVQQHKHCRPFKRGMVASTNDSLLLITFNLQPLNLVLNRLLLLIVRVERLFQL